MAYTESFDINFRPTADAEAVVSGPHVRFTVLTSRMLRLEYDAQDRFEDRPSQAFWYRRQPVPRFDVRREGDTLEIETDHLLLRYQDNTAGFTADSLSITLKESATTWRYGQEDMLNLLGTARTLDNVDGALVLEEGLLSRQGWAVYDDSHTLVFNAQGWLEPRQQSIVNSQQSIAKDQLSMTGQAAESASTRDLYFFGFGREYQACLTDFTAVAGAAPLVPRWILGNWWSRYWAYSDEELLGLMDEFRAHEVPLSVCIVDMDWHITDTGNASSGWTGYTWNRELFPDPPGFIAELHRRGLKTALNLHPADGVYPHEAQYREMAQRLGLDPDGQTHIPFNIADPQFTEAYFELLHHPYEADGVDFWWMDWQQGRVSGVAGLDPLWWLNHLHFHDLARDGLKRSFVFSRWGGLGNHRYPIGFSGDALVTWDSLAFQPYFTATAANVNYGWWSHDIGGHMGGVEDPELFARWVQFGVFSPIFRLHCTNNAFHERRPWAYDARTEAVTSAAMRLRHALIPYLYTMAWLNHTQHAPLVRPMYHEYAAQEPAYHCPDQYTFGSELIVAPFIEPADKDTRLSRQVVWLPEGDWYGFFNTERYPGDGWYVLHGALEEIPVFAGSGAIVPLAAPGGWSDTENPQTFIVHLFPGADHEFLLYEDDGLAVKQCLTPISQVWSAQEWRATIAPAQGDSSFLPTERSFELWFRGVIEGVNVEATVDGQPVSVTPVYDEQTATLKVPVPAKTAGQALVVTLVTVEDSLQRVGDYRLPACRRLVRAFKMESWTKQRLDRELPAIVQKPSLLAKYELSLTAEQIRALAEVITDSGYHRASIRWAKDEAIILWNNAESDAVSYQLLAEDLNRFPVIIKESLPRFAVLHIGENLLRLHKGELPAAGHLTVDDWFDSLAERIGPAMESSGALTGAETAVLQCDILGAQGRSAFLTLAEGEQAKLTDGQHHLPDMTITADSGDWLPLINGLSAPEEAFLADKIKVSGNFDLAMRLASVIGMAPAHTYLADRWRFALNYLDMLSVSLGND